MYALTPWVLLIFFFLKNILHAIYPGGLLGKISDTRGRVAHILWQSQSQDANEIQIFSPLGLWSFGVAPLLIYVTKKSDALSVETF